MAGGNEIKYIVHPGDVFGDLVFVQEIGIPDKGRKDRRGGIFECKCGNIVKYKLAQFFRSKTRKCLQCYNKSEEFIKSRHKGKPGERARNEMYSGYKSQASKRGLVFNLSKNDFFLLSKRNCFYCGEEPGQIRGGYFKKRVKNKDIDHIYISNGIDRINSKEGYYAKNCVACCEKCNWAKLNNSIEEFLEKIDVIFVTEKERKNGA